MRTPLINKKYVGYFFALCTQMATIPVLDSKPDGVSGADEAGTGQLKQEIERLKQEYKKDGQRIAYSLQEALYSSGDYVCSADGLDHIEIKKGSYRDAIDSLMGA